MEWVENPSVKVSAWSLGLQDSKCSARAQQNGKKSHASTGLLVEPCLYARLLIMFLKTLNKINKKKKRKMAEHARLNKLTDFLTKGNLTDLWFSKVIPL